MEMRQLHLKLCIKATLSRSAPSPVTIQTYSTIFNPALGLKRRAFTAEDLSVSPPSAVGLEITKGPKRPGFARRKGSTDEKYYLTLRPGEETVVRAPFNAVRRTMKREDGEGERAVFLPGHTYRLGVSEGGKRVRTWWWGTAEDVLDEAEGESKDVSGLEGKGDLVLDAGAGVEFRIASTKADERRADEGQV